MTVQFWPPVHDFTVGQRWGTDKRKSGRVKVWTSGNTSVQKSVVYIALPMITVVMATWMFLTYVGEGSCWWQPWNVGTWFSTSKKPPSWRKMSLTWLWPVKFSIGQKIQHIICRIFLSPIVLRRSNCTKTGKMTSKSVFPKSDRFWPLT